MERRERPRIPSVTFDIDLTDRTGFSAATRRDASRIKLLGARWLAMADNKMMMIQLLSDNENKQCLLTLIIINNINSGKAITHTGVSLKQNKYYETTHKPSSHITGRPG